MSGSHAAQVESFDHHLCHAASAYYASSFESSLIVTLDEFGDGSLRFRRTRPCSEIREILSLAFPNSLAYVYSQVTRLLGFQPRSDEHKTQWLSMEGEPAHKDAFLEILRRQPNGPPQIDPKFFTRAFGTELSFTPEFYRRLTNPRAQREVACQRIRARRSLKHATRQHRRQPPIRQRTNRLRLARRPPQGTQRIVALPGWGPLLESVTRRRRRISAPDSNASSSSPPPETKVPL